MYTACVSCDRDLGRNAELPGFPVGRRTAFDRGTGRIWVICRHCEEWNLGLIETRWEAVEAADRLAADSEVSANGTEMGLARTVGGLELLRVGGLSKADIANWRYGRILARRRRLAYATIAVLGVLVAVVGAAAHMGARDEQPPLVRLGGRDVSGRARARARRASVGGAGSDQGSPVLWS